MKIKTKVFGEVTIDDDKAIHFPAGIIGFPDMTEFALTHDEEKGAGSIHWLQSLQEPAFAMPVMDPLIVKPDYNPEIEDELLSRIGKLDPGASVTFIKEYDDFWAVIEYNGQEAYVAKQYLTEAE